MRILVLSSVYPSETRPTFGVFVQGRVRHVAAHGEVVIVAPIPWFPFNRWIRGWALAATPFQEVQDGITVYHPRFICIPGIGKCLDGMLYFLSLLAFIRSLRRRFAFELIDAHFAYPDGFGGVLLGKIFGVPVVVTLRGAHDLRQTRHALRRPQVIWALGVAARLISVSDALRDVFVDLGVDRRKVRVVPNGVDSLRFHRSDRREARQRLGLPPDRTILLAVGNLIEGKGHHRLVEILADLVVRRPDLLLVVVGGEVSGDGHRRILESLVRRHGLEGHVRLVGPRPHHEIPVWMAAADLFCLATESEGWCNAVMEALACGLPVVTTRVGGNAELVRDGRDGLLVPFWDGSSFRAAILRALEMPWDREEIATRAGAMGWHETAEQVAEEFHLVLDSANAAVRHALSR